MSFDNFFFCAMNCMQWHWKQNSVNVYVAIIKSTVKSTVRVKIYYLRCCSRMQTVMKLLLLILTLFKFDAIVLNTCTKISSNNSVTTRTIHTRWSRGLKNPHGSNSGIPKEPTILMLSTVSTVVYPATSALSEDRMNGTAPKSAS